jgi:hypothetical protein
MPWKVRIRQNARNQKPVLTNAHQDGQTYSKLDKISRLGSRMLLLSEIQLIKGYHWLTVRFSANIITLFAHDFPLDIKPPPRTSPGCRADGYRGRGCASMSATMIASSCPQPKLSLLPLLENRVVMLRRKDSIVWLVMLTRGILCCHKNVEIIL